MGPFRNLAVSAPSQFPGPFEIGSEKEFGDEAIPMSSVSARWYRHCRIRLPAFFRIARHIKQGRLPEARTGLAQRFDARFASPGERSCPMTLSGVPSFLGFLASRVWFLPTVYQRITSQKARSVTRTVPISGDPAVLMGNVETRGEQKSEVIRMTTVFPKRGEDRQVIAIHVSRKLNLNRALLVVHFAGSQFPRLARHLRRFWRLGFPPSHRVRYSLCVCGALGAQPSIRS